MLFLQCYPDRAADLLLNGQSVLLQEMGSSLVNPKAKTLFFADLLPAGAYDVTDTLAAVVRAEPDWSRVPKDLSPTLLVFLRRYRDETILCVNNLSRFAQAVAIARAISRNGCQERISWHRRSRGPA